VHAAAHGVRSPNGAEVTRPTSAQGESWRPGTSQAARAFAQRRAPRRASLPARKADGDFAEALPEQRRRTVVWPIDPYPVFRPLTQAFADGIHQDVIRLLVHFVMVAQAMIEEVALPIHAVFPATYFFQFLITVVIPGSRGKARMACK
jgi:hypothetical protein